MKPFQSSVHVRLVVLLALLVLALAVQASAQTENVVKLAKFDGPVTPVLASYIDHAISDAEAQNARALIIELDTPGGSVDITTKLTQRMQASSVPIVVWVAPSGAHAGSAGTFITLAGHIAAMAPGSSIGAASPISSEGQDLGETAKAKAVNILVADIKNLAARRGDTAVAWPKKAVAEAAAATAQEAHDLGVVDIIAGNTDDLLRQLDGRTVTLQGRPVTLQVAGAQVEEVPLSPWEGLLNQITNPALAAILLTIGINAILFELSSPGGYAAGILGVICVLLAFYALGTINANWAGLGFVLVAVVLFVLDIKAPTHGALTLGGIVSFVFGLYLLYNTSDVGVPWPSIIVSGLATGAFFAFAVAKAVAIQRRPAASGMTSMVGMEGVVRQRLEPCGEVLVNGELWEAESEAGWLDVDTPIVVTGQDGFRLSVRRGPGRN
ncbi:MAG: NfeD family protein [Nitrososphaerales archaeon]